MNDKIQKLIKKLAKECQKEDVALSLAAIDLEGEMAISQVGKGTIVAIAAHRDQFLTEPSEELQKIEPEWEYDEEEDSRGNTL
ncbi:hypothetical protein [Enterococcus faecalis]|uniref:hypothetical protein n=1 Tax=Enterococcus faecalis TaxID=1351 RepID=UPI00070A8E92|nr:hypothetical protein [Enterococcus faecalis]KXF71037.1 hypothetical protein AQ486_03850 [Enterococcus faecalis]